MNALNELLLVIIDGHPQRKINLKTTKTTVARSAGQRKLDARAILNVFPMDVQKTMEFILRQQAKAEGEMAAMRRHQADSEAKAERQMAPIRKLIQTGMRMIVKNDEQIKELAAAQKVTETELQGLIDVL